MAEDTMAAQLAAKYAVQMAAQDKPEPLKVVEPIKNEPVKVEDTKVEPLKTEPVKVEPIIVAPKSFEEQLNERSKGKYSKWEDLEIDLTPKEQIEFANEKIKHLNDLAKKGIDVTSKEFLDIQSLDVNKIDKVEDAIFEKWKRGEEGKGLSDKTIKHEINKKYNVEEWIEKEEADLTEDDIANREKMSRDAVLSKDWLTNYKNERVLEKQVDPKVSEALAKEAQVQQKNWETFVDSELINKVKKLTVPVSYIDEKGKTVDSEADYEVSEQDRKEVGEIMKQLIKDSDAIFKQHRNEKGLDNPNSLFTMLLKAKTADQRAAMAYTKGAEQRALIIEKAGKNTNFVPNQTEGKEKVFANMQEALADAVKNKKL